MKAKNLLGRHMSRKSDRLTYQSGHPKPALETVPDLVEPLVGWRAWKVWSPLSSYDSCPTLSSVILDTPWAPRRKITAEHSFDLGEKCRGLVVEGCSCGVYAFKDAVDAFAYLMRVRDRLIGMSVEVALGQVNLWGKVVECERGFKSQFAYPRHIYLPAAFSRFMPEISSAFGVAVGVYASTCDEQFSVVIPRPGEQRDSQILCLKNTKFPQLEDLAFEVGFYDLKPFSDHPHHRRSVCSGDSLPFSGTCELL